jgi:hypothetical protein
MMWYNLSSEEEEHFANAAHPSLQNVSHSANRTEHSRKIFANVDDGRRDKTLNRSFSTVRRKTICSNIQTHIQKYI